MSLNSLLLGVGITVVLFLLLIINRHRLKQLTGARAQRMCPFCGMITSSFRPLCLECGKPLRIKRV